MPARNVHPASAAVAVLRADAHAVAGVFCNALFTIRTTSLHGRQRGAASGDRGAVPGQAHRRRKGGGMEQRWGLSFISWSSRLRPSIWDVVAIPLVLGVVALFAWGGSEMSVPYQFGDA